jgi:hypothetical protein
LLAKRKEIKKPRRPRNANPVARESSEWSPKTKGTPKTFQAGETEGTKIEKLLSPFAHSKNVAFDTRRSLFGILDQISLTRKTPKTAASARTSKV